MTGAPFHEPPLARQVLDGAPGRACASLGQRI